MTMPRGPFREQRDGLVPFHRTAHSANLPLHCTTLRATNQYGIILRCKPTNYRPFRNIVTRHKGTARRPRQRHDIQPALMIGNIEYVATERLPDNLNPRAA
jgi:hypothetical protein